MARCPTHGRTRTLGGFYNPEWNPLRGYHQAFYVRHACTCCRRIADDSWATPAEVRARESDVEAV